MFVKWKSIQAVSISNVNYDSCRSHIKGMGSTSTSMILVTGPPLIPVLIKLKGVSYINIIVIVIVVIVIVVIIIVTIISAPFCDTFKLFLKNFHSTPQWQDIKSSCLFLKKVGYPKQSSSSSSSSSSIVISALARAKRKTVDRLISKATLENLISATEFSLIMAVFFTVLHAKRCCEG